ncbi:MAG: ABC transporter permease/substrate-binding protein, partial [Candidatus Methylacidiphilales bacterium]
MTLAAVLVASVIGFTLALSVRDKPRISMLLLNFCNTLQTVPSLALLALLLPLFGIGAKPAIAALIIYALQPIVRNTLMAIRECPGELVDAGYSMGLNSSQILWNIQLPQGLPLLIAGLRTATVWSVGTATLGAFIMAGGLGEFINRGIAMNNYTLVLLGAVPAAALAIGLDSLLGIVEGMAQRWKNGFPMTTSSSRAPATAVAVAGVAVLALTVVPAVLAATGNQRMVRVGCKNFSEQRVLGELIAQRIEAKLGVPVKREFGFGSTQLLHSAFVRGEIDVYVEYTGTAEQTILKLPPAPPGETKTVNDQDLIRKLYAERFAALWLKPLGFNNSYTMICRRDSAGSKF